MNEFDEIFDGMDRVFNRLFDISSFHYLPPPDGWQPPANLYETPDKYILIVELAGMNRKDIKVRLDSGRLIITGTRRLPGPRGALKCHNLEISAGNFSRVLRIDDIPDKENIQARYRSGLLIIELPKRKGQ
jgi:HSP20 family protein